jgi:uncharacterized protein YqgC (DUF456 family)
MIDKVTALLAFAVLLGFLGILVGFVPSLDLMIVIAVVVLMAGYEFYQALFKSRNGG